MKKTQAKNLEWKILMKQEIISLKKQNLNKLMIKKHKIACTALNYIEQLLILIYVAARSVSISAYASLIGIPLGIVSSTLGLKIYSITAEVKM